MTLSQNGRPSPLDELYEYAKNKGTITYQEVTDRLGNTFFEADQLEKVLDKLESLGVTVVDSAEIPDTSPAAMEVPDPALNDDLSEADVCRRPGAHVFEGNRAHSAANERSGN